MVPPKFRVQTLDSKHIRSSVLSKFYLPISPEIRLKAQINKFISESHFQLDLRLVDKQLDIYLIIINYQSKLLFVELVHTMDSIG